MRNAFGNAFFKPSFLTYQSSLCRLIRYSPRLCTVALCIILGIFLVACTAKTIDRKPVRDMVDINMDKPKDKEAISQIDIYSDQAVGTVTELYGASAEFEQSQAYRDAVHENPLLSHIIVYFDFNQATIKPESRGALLQHAEYLSERAEVEISLEGHADKRGSSGYNLSLGERRALTVKDFLRSNGVQGFQISVLSYGEERPAVVGNREEAYSKNRRVELIYR